ncbi:MAG: hypothetical protein QME81_05195, partial [bacterium]|nr:hypothetical protein [bacterium]
MWISGILFAGLFILVMAGILWDTSKRKKLEKREKQLERIEKLEKAIKAYSRKKKPALAEVLREAGLMLVLVLCLLSVAGWTSAAEVAVRDEEIIERLTRLETMIGSLQRQIDDVNKNLQRQIDDGNKNLQRQIDDVKSDVRWIGGILFAGMFVVVGFVLWDRRTALAPVVKKNEELEKRNEAI